MTGLLVSKVYRGNASVRGCIIDGRLSGAGTARTEIVGLFRPFFHDVVEDDPSAGPEQNSEDSR